MTDRVALVLIAAIWTLPACAQTASGSIEGQTVNLKTGAPLRGARVYLFGPSTERALGPFDHRKPAAIHLQVESDDRGRFAFHDLPAGNYQLNSGHDGFVPGDYIENRVVSVLLPVAEGQQVKDAILKLAPFGAIAGRVTDESGAPLTNARITFYGFVDGAWIQHSQAGTRSEFDYTDDLGQYRAPLPAGAYLVSAAYPFGLAWLEPDITPGLGHPTTYYPDALDPDHAHPLTVASGETVKADITLKKGRAYRIRGHLADPSGRVWSRACVGILPKGSLASNVLLLGSIEEGAQDGSFTIVAIPPGSYLLTGSLCQNGPPVAGVRELEVTGDVNGVIVSVTPPQQIHGTVKLEGKANLAGVTVNLQPVERFTVGRSPTAAVSRAGPLTFENAFTIHYLPRLSGLPPNCYVKSIRYGGQEVPPSGLQPAGNASLDITLSVRRVAQLTGVATNRAGQPVRYPMVTATPSDGGPASSSKAVTGGEDGKFAFPALRPGKYRVTAWETRVGVYILPMDPGLLKLSRERGKVVRVKPGKPPSVALTSIGVEEAAGGWAAGLARGNP